MALDHEAIYKSHPTVVSVDDGACKLKDPPPDAAFSLIFAVIVN